MSSDECHLVQFKFNLKFDLNLMFWHQIQHFTHTNTQIYTRFQYKEAICKIDKLVS